jgi:hypothetical protein
LISSSASLAMSSRVFILRLFWSVFFTFIDKKYYTNLLYLEKIQIISGKKKFYTSLFYLEIL